MPTKDGCEGEIDPGAGGNEGSVADGTVAEAVEARDDGDEGDRDTDGALVNSVVVLMPCVTADGTACIIVVGALVLPAADDVEDANPCDCWTALVALSCIFDLIALDGAGSEP